MGRFLARVLDERVHGHVRGEAVGDVADFVGGVDQVADGVDARVIGDDDLRPEHYGRDAHPVAARRHHGLGVVLVVHDVDPRPGGERQEGEQLTRARGGEQQLFRVGLPVLAAERGVGAELEFGQGRGHRDPVSAVIVAVAGPGRTGPDQARVIAVRDCYEPTVGR